MSLKRISTNFSTMEEIQTRLKSEEAKKARNLLETAMSSMQAFKVVKDQISKDVLLGKNTIFIFNKDNKKE